MGHDIYAFRNHVNRDAMRHEYRLDEQDDQWLDRYEAYRSICFVAYLRRSAFDSYNRTIYEALGAQEAYGGCSGFGNEIRFDLGQIEAAIRYIELKAQEPVPEREPNQADELFRQIEGDAVFAETIAGSTYESLAPELDFLKKCREYLQDNRGETVEILFG